jgi:hypothetical protein
MPQSIPKGLTRECVLQALTDLDAGIEHPFGSPTGYELVHEGKRYAPKAVIGLACRSLLGRMLRPEELSRGEAPGQANFVLRELGFLVVPKDAGSGLEESEVDLGPAGLVLDHIASCSVHRGPGHSQHTPNSVAMATKCLLVLAPAKIRQESSQRKKQMACPGRP